MAIGRKHIDTAYLVTTLVGFLSCFVESVCLSLQIQTRRSITRVLVRPRKVLPRRLYWTYGRVD